MHSCHCSACQYYSRNYLKSDPFKKFVALDTRSWPVSQRSNWSVERGFRVWRGLEVGFPIPLPLLLVELLIGHPLLLLGLTLHLHFLPLKFAQFTQITGPCLCQQSLSPLWWFNVPARQARIAGRLQLLTSNEVAEQYSSFSLFPCF